MCPPTSVVDAVKGTGAGLVPLPGTSLNLKATRPASVHRKCTASSRRWPSSQWDALWLKPINRPIRWDHLEVTVKTHRARVFCTQRCLQKQESLVSHLLFLNGNYWEFIRADCHSMHLKWPSSYIWMCSEDEQKAAYWHYYSLYYITVIEWFQKSHEKVGN